MKIGYRKPSFKKSVKARTTGKIKRKAKKAVNPLYGKKGMGYVKNPKQAVRNKVYHKMTFGTNDIIRAATSIDTASSSSTNNSKVASKNTNSKMNTREMNPTTYFLVVLFLGGFGVHRFIDGSIATGILYSLTLGLFGIGWIIDLFKSFSLLIKSNTNNFNYDKEKLLQLQKIVSPNSPDTLVMTEQQLLEAAHHKAENDIRIVQESRNILLTTVKPDVYFSRLNLLKSHTYQMQLLEPFISFTVSPTAAMNEYLANQNELTHQFILRYYNSVADYADSLKTNKGKYNQYQKFYDTLSIYQSEMSPENFNYIEQLFRQTTDQLSANDK